MRTKPYVIHVPYGYFPDPIGGTEIYVRSLARSLKKIGIESMIAAPSDQNSSYEIDHIKVVRFALSPLKNNRVLWEIYGEGNALAAFNFGKILDKYQPTMVHLHAYSPGVSLMLLEETKKRSLLCRINHSKQLRWILFYALLA